MVVIGLNTSQKMKSDYMEIFSPGWNFNLLNRNEISPRMTIERTI